MKKRTDKLGAPPAARRTDSRRRGFTLIELAIAMAVVGLLLGAALIPMRALDEKRQLQAEMHRLEVVRDAIVGYALRHRTRARTIKFVTGPAAQHSEWEFRLPGGRPYLPCPDWDGDGFEDRLPFGTEGFRRGVEVKPDLKVTVSLGAVYRGNDGALFWLTPDEGGVQYPYGECSTARGAVPWRTLGVEPSDGWGNRHTYFADPVFSNAIFGFDRRTIADIFDARLPRAPGSIPTRRFRNRDVNSYASNCPAVICDGGRAGDCTYHSFHVNVCLWREDLDTLVLKAGSVTKDPILRGALRSRAFPAGGVTDGLPFVLVSHGPNGRYAINHWATLRPKTGLDLEFGGQICNHDAWADPTGFPYYVIPREETVLLREGVNGNRVGPRGRNDCPEITREIRTGGLVISFNPSFFVWEPPGIVDRSGFDDLLVWMTREELSLSMGEGIPPLPPMVIAHFPE